MRISDWSSDVCSSDLQTRCAADDETAAARDIDSIVGDQLMTTCQQLQRQFAFADADGASQQYAGLMHAHEYAVQRQSGGRVSSEERRVGKECSSPCSSWRSTFNS